MDLGPYELNVIENLWQKSVLHYTPWLFDLTGPMHHAFVEGGGRRIWH